MGLVKPTEKHVGVGKAAGANAIKANNQPYLIEIKAHEMRRLVWLIGAEALCSGQLEGGHRQLIL